jgi:hypothetical protein
VLIDAQQRALNDLQFTLSRRMGLEEQLLPQVGVALPCERVVLLLLDDAPGGPRPPHACPCPCPPARPRPPAACGSSSLRSEPRRPASPPPAGSVAVLQPQAAARELQALLRNALDPGQGFSRCTLPGLAAAHCRALQRSGWSLIRVDMAALLSAGSQEAKEALVRAALDGAR